MLAQWELAWLAQVLTDLPVQWGWPQVPAALTGGLMGAACLAWLKHRARSVMPAHAAARLAELQARIRPHFLFNTLNTAIALVQVDPPRAERVLEDLAELFRQALAAPQGRSTLADEIALSRRYLDIEQLRFGERLQVRWQLDPAANATVLPPLILQPLVENAVRHGVEPSAEGGWVSVQTQAAGWPPGADGAQQRAPARRLAVCAGARHGLAQRAPAPATDARRATGFLGGLQAGRDIGRSPPSTKCG